MRTILFLILTIPLVTHGANFACAGKVTTLALGPSSGILQVNAGHGVHYLCKFHTTMNGVNPETCQAWYSMLLTAKTAGKEIRQNYTQVAGGAQDCASLGSWVVPNPMPYWVEIRD